LTTSRERRSRTACDELPGDHDLDDLPDEIVDAIERLETAFRG
jgi:hypothetical protein